MSLLASVTTQIGPRTEETLTLFMAGAQVFIKCFRIFVFLIVHEDTWWRKTGVLK
jgi:hypothetical protein